MRSRSAWNNWFVKHRLAAYHWWFRDLSQRYGNDPAFQRMLPGYKRTMDQSAANDATAWQGWFGRHGGEVEFLGDHVAGGAVAFQVVLVVLFAGLAGAVYGRAGKRQPGGRAGPSAQHVAGVVISQVHTRKPDH